MPFRIHKTLFDIFLLVILSFPFARQAYSDSVKEGLTSYQKGHYQKAARAFSTPESQKNPDVQYRLGLMYLEGKGVKKNVTKAIDWLTRSAENDFPAAQYELFNLVKEDRTTAISEEKALHWLKKSNQK